jgi:hypothetical protein
MNRLLPYELDPLMRRFVVSLFLGVGLATGAAVGLARMLFPDQVSSGASSTSAPLGSAQQGEFRGEDFRQQDAVETVAERFGSSAEAERVRQALRSGAVVTYHSFGHWTVKLGEASWTAHGVGIRYAEPDNDSAKAVESLSGLSPAANTQRLRGGPRD